MIENKKMDILGSKLEFDISKISIKNKPAFNEYKISLRKSTREKKYIFTY